MKGDSCFYCDGYATNLDCYQITSRNKKCVWREIAEGDLENSKKGGLVFLVKMLNEYQNTNDIDILNDEDLK